MGMDRLSLGDCPEKLSYLMVTLIVSLFRKSKVLSICL
jgi:hypothetical protein